MTIEVYGNICEGEDCTEVVLGTTDLTSLVTVSISETSSRESRAASTILKAAYNKRSTMLRTYLTGLLVWGLSSTGLAQAPQTTEAADNEPAVEFIRGLLSDPLQIVYKLL